MTRKNFNQSEVQEFETNIFHVLKKLLSKFMIMYTRLIPQVIKIIIIFLGTNSNSIVAGSSEWLEFRESIIAGP